MKVPGSILSSRSPFISRFTSQTTASVDDLDDSEHSSDWWQQIRERVERPVERPVERLVGPNLGSHYNATFDRVHRGYFVDKHLSSEEVADLKAELKARARRVESLESDVLALNAEVKVLEDELNAAINSAGQDSPKDADQNIRCFEFTIGANVEGLELPSRKTKSSAGYDFRADNDYELLPLKPTFVWTSVKARIPETEFLQLSLRSSVAAEGIILTNGVGVVDADYYGNPVNDGNIGFCLVNLRMSPYNISRGQRIGQGIFLPYGRTNDDHKYEKKERLGGYGSTGEK